MRIIEIIINLFKINEEYDPEISDSEIHYGESKRPPNKIPKDAPFDTLYAIEGMIFYNKYTNTFQEEPIFEEDIEEVA